MKICIWCKRTDEETSFVKEAHIVPKNLGGRRICTNVCDDCNHYFGATTKELREIETVLKETFNIARARFLDSISEVGKNKAMSRFSSTYFNCDLKNHKLSIKPKYKLHKAFQENPLVRFCKAYPSTIAFAMRFSFMGFTYYKYEV